MSANRPTTIEQRLALLEREVEGIKHQIARDGRGARREGKSGAGWLDHLSGSMQEFPDFDQVLELGQAIRREDAPETPTGPSEGTNSAA